MPTPDRIDSIDPVNSVDWIDRFNRSLLDQPILDQSLSDRALPDRPEHLNSAVSI